MGLATFMASTAGRLLRVVLGIVLIAIGVTIGGPAGWVIAVIGLVPIAAGVANVCLIGPLIGAPFRGSELRR
ncbi:MAG: DUF2892 domain-containing protein [Dehalococcoidia bacterium]|nr:DUF2892 domain-containing protein [Dehalococcoidia bacterium]